MATSIFVNLPVRDLDASKAFFAGLGYSFNEQFTDEKAACMVIDDRMFAMLLVEPFFATFVDKPVADARASTEVLVALSFYSAHEVRAKAETALSFGARRHKEPQDLGRMFQWGFEDLDGHIWELLWADPAHSRADCAHARTACRTALSAPVPLWHSTYRAGPRRTTA